MLYGRRSDVGGFTLIELLVVISIISLLLGILLPALGAATRASRTAACLSNQHQLAIGVQTYAADFNDAIPRGPAITSFLAQSAGGPGDVMEYEVASSMLQLPMSTMTTSHGELLDGYIPEPKAMYCPGDDTNDPQEELARIGTSSPMGAFSSYLYRQLDQAPGGRAAHMGMNDEGRPAKAIFMDSNSLGDEQMIGPGTERSNHRANPVNIAFIDGHSKTVQDPEHVLAVRFNDYLMGYTSIERAYNRAFQHADEQ